MISVQQLQKMLAGLNCQEVGSQPKKKNKKKNKGGAVKPVVVVTAGTSNQPKKKKKKKNRGGNKPGAMILGKPDFVISKKEFVRSINGANGGKDWFAISCNLFPICKKFAVMFEEYRIVKCQFHYVPTVGSQTNGSILFASDMGGVFIKGTTPSFTKTQLSQLQDPVQTSVTKPVTVTVRCDQDDKLLYSTTSATGNPLITCFGWVVEGNEKVVGDLWCTYTMHFYGPQPVE